MTSSTPGLMGSVTWGQTHFCGTVAVAGVVVVLVDSYKIRQIKTVKQSRKKT